MKNHRLIIIGASAMGREVAHYAKECVGNNAQWNVIGGFLDSRRHILDGYEKYPPILDSVEEYVPRDEDVFVCALGDPMQKMSYIRLIKDKGGIFVSVIHPEAYIGCNVVVGQGCVICPNATITADTKIGDHVIVNVNASISHDCNIGEGTTIAPGCAIAGWCNIGICVDFGIQSAVLPRRRIIENTIIGAGAVVVKNIEESGTYIGCPASRLR